ncbi:MAG: lipo-like protein [Pseudomonadales bacterium]|nr:lipo-like protein [Pseudomonadales bacterium]
MFSAITRAIGQGLASFLSKSLPGYRKLDTVPLERVHACLQAGDIVLVEGNTRISIAIKYLTQSSWSHAALYVGAPGDSSADPVLLEADLKEGVRLVSLDHYADFNLRICRAAELKPEEIATVIDFARSKLGHRYDLKNVLDLVRYLIQRPVVPSRYRRSLIGFGSGEPTRAICSTLIAESFQAIDYPILPIHNGDTGDKGEVPQFYRRHFTHFTPRDFDLSPYFRIIKPTIEGGFDYRQLVWAEPPRAEQLR